MNSDRGTPYARRYAAIIGAALAAVVIFSNLIFGVAFLFFRTESVSARASQIVQLPEDLLPGNPVPQPCDQIWPPDYLSDSSYCQITLNSRRIYVTYSVRHGTITRLSYSGQGETVGDLMLAWGMPTGMRDRGWAVEVFWDKRSIFASAKPFNPNSSIYWISYTLNPEATRPWRGFVNG